MMSALIAVMSIPTDSEVSQCGQLYDSAFQLFVAWTALMATKFTCWKSFLQCAHKLMSVSVVVEGGSHLPGYGGNGL